ncbi:MAG: hypothetical protein ACI9JM_001308 [Halioglobus sp.]|jgi:hypothetical protein
MSVVTIEAELDYKIDASWKVGVFSDTSRAQGSFLDLDQSEHINTYGAGFHYMLARRYGFSMGMDVARGPKDTAVYIQAGSNG